MLILDAYKLKWIAIVGMILNHMVIAWWQIIPLWLALPMYGAGGVTFPIMAFLAVEGYKKTSNLSAYLGRLALVGVIATAFHPLTMGVFMLNIMFTLALGLLCIKFYDSVKRKWVFWTVFPAICLLTLLPITFDWAITGLIMMIMYHVIVSENRRIALPIVVIAGLTAVFALLGTWSLSNAQQTMAEPYLSETIELLTAGKGTDVFYLSYAFAVGNLGSMWFIKRYNGERGQQAKWLFYVIYPLHLAVLGGVALVMGWVDLGVFLIW